MNVQSRYRCQNKQPGPGIVKASQKEKLAVGETQKPGEDE